MAIDADKKLVDKAAKRLTTPKSLVANATVSPEEITRKIKEVIAKFVDTSAINLTKLIDGSSVNHPTASNAIAIHDLVRRINGSGLKWHTFFLVLNMMADILKFTETPVIYETSKSMTITNTIL